MSFDSAQGKELIGAIRLAWKEDIKAAVKEGAKEYGEIRRASRGSNDTTQPDHPPDTDSDSK
ncbi:hypothetical protein EON65_53000 [archaeon]|nr:MAG: hypothetical protein EON65_53000 [archaeon]